MRKYSRAIQGVAAAASAYLFWIGYLPPFTKFHLHSDIEGYHWPLLVAAFEAVRHGRLPLWDPSIYCGVPFAGNIQTALFYPPTWLLFAANVASRHILFKSLEAWVFLHAGLAAFLSFLWLRRRNFCPLASALGASVFAFGGYMVSQNSHVGAVTGLAWTPLAWLGIDEMADTGRLGPLWKVIAALSLCLLAGYPATFVAFAIGTITYALGRSLRLGIPTAVAIAFSLAVSAIAVVPAAEASIYKTFDPKYGTGVWDPLFYVQFLVPDWAGLRVGDPHTYLYLGVPVLFGIPWFVRRIDLPIAAVLMISTLFLLDPFGLIMRIVYRSGLMAQVLSNYSFVEPATLAFAFVAANGIDAYLRQEKVPSLRQGTSKWLAYSVAIMVIAWSVYRLIEWPHSVSGWNSVAQTAITGCLFVAGLLSVRRGWSWIAIVICIAVFVDYKIAGTGHAFSSIPGDLDASYPRGRFPGVSSEVFDAMRNHREYRLAVDGVHATDLRRYGLASPQGFDPLLPSQYKSFIEKFQLFRTNRIFELAPQKKDMLQQLGVRYFLTRDVGIFQMEVAEDPDFHPIGEPSSFIKVYEYKEASPGWHWYGIGDATKRQWQPEIREFFVDAKAAGRLVLLEQFYPGWCATIDGKSTEVHRFEQVFQSVIVPRGNHIVRFEYRPRSLLIGAIISTMALTGIWVWLRKDRNRGLTLTVGTRARPLVPR